MTQQSAMPDLVALQSHMHTSSGHILVRRIRFLAAMAVSGLIFWYFGWWVARPTDPQSAVALLMVDQGVVTMAELLGLAVVVSGLAVAICGAGSAGADPSRSRLGWPRSRRGPARWTSWCFTA
ncbi:MAG: hypothetical protein IPK83_07200 [Planctomycetes bacterium]|nr:hypothetical protein [Planctomycetota bacterium]